MYVCMYVSWYLGLYIFQALQQRELSIEDYDTLLGTHISAYLNIYVIRAYMYIHMCFDMCIYILSSAVERGEYRRLWHFIRYIYNVHICVFIYACMCVRMYMSWYMGLCIFQALQQREWSIEDYGTLLGIHCPYNLFIYAYM
jgi:hypothetical protein